MATLCRMRCLMMACRLAVSDATGLTPPGLNTRCCCCRYRDMPPASCEPQQTSA
ncbi:hypothetical protein PR003_g10821 [Phytophthora rubi]|uniref:Uncharacterized protein n=1 Tax=Phytophthora rubi TaxID=129364 RepID=A0A6A3MBM5_9STRA|nr:hypothetical protein PR002_g10623 [Phytophthora rubi]KAE9033089.1 hypothetical protein PR001_g10315 [Phytophthora rubi]KAE9339800.1 hypothetical protein PR003_g10821 [Phytophthora rubi]